MKTLRISCIMLFVSAFTFANVTSKEKKALIAIHASTNGDQWNTPWDLTKEVSSWYGVTVDNDKVVGIDLSFNNLNGTLPEAIGDLVNLQCLTLFKNELTGPIPASIGNLKQLKHLNVGLNKLTGTIPTTIVGLEKLELLQLFMNQLTGQIPPEIGYLKNLKSLEL